MSELLKVPRFDLAKLEARRDRLAGALRAFIGGVPKQETLYDIADVLAMTFKLESRSVGLIETCRTLPNTPLTERTLHYFASRLAARYDDLVAGRPIRPWSGQSVSEWIAFEILEAEHGRDRKDRFITNYWLQSLSGSVCPRVVQKMWTPRQCGYFSRALGFTRRSGQLPYSDSRQLVGLRFAGLVEPERSKNGPDFSQITVPGSCLTFNKVILQARIRRDPPCPKSYSHPCHTCPVGYDNCLAAVHPLTFCLEWCGGCEQESFFDPAVDQDRCVTCRSSKKLRKQGDGSANAVQTEVRTT